MVCNIFGGAEIGDYSGIPHADGLIAAADGGYTHCVKLGLDRKINVLIGDFDSIDCMPDNVPVITAAVRKNDTDLMLAIKWGFEHGCNEFHIYGCLGGRPGHTAASIQSLLYIRKQGGSGILYGDTCMIEVIGSGRKEICDFGIYRHISFFSVDDVTEAELSPEFSYSGNITYTKDFPLGVSNEIIFGHKGYITVKSGNLIGIWEKE